MKTTVQSPHRSSLGEKSLFGTVHYPPRRVDEAIKGCGGVCWGLRVDMGRCRVSLGRHGYGVWAYIGTFWENLGRHRADLGVGALRADQAAGSPGHGRYRDTLVRHGLETLEAM